MTSQDKGGAAAVQNFKNLTREQMLEMLETQHAEQILQKQLADKIDEHRVKLELEQWEGTGKNADKVYRYLKISGGIFGKGFNLNSERIEALKDLDDVLQIRCNDLSI